MVADAAGGHSPNTARMAAVALSSSDEGKWTNGVVLLQDLQTVCSDRAKMSTQDILAGLCALPESRWNHFHGHGSAITDRDLSRLLRPYGIGSKDVWMGDRSVKGYTADEPTGRMGQVRTPPDSPRGPRGPRGLELSWLTNFPAARCVWSYSRAGPWVAAPRRARLARDPLQISETVLDPVIHFVRHSKSANCGRGSIPAATAKDTERARVRAHRYGYPYRNTECNSGAEQHFRDHQMPNRWSRTQMPDRGSRYMWRFHCALRRASRGSCHLSHRSMNPSSILSIAITMLGLRCFVPISRHVAHDPVLVLTEVAFVQRRASVPASYPCFTRRRSAVWLM